MTKYRLYVLPPDAKGLEKASAERFSRVTGSYVLVYTSEELDKPEITDAEIWRLSAEDGQWLERCNVTLLLEDFAQRQEQIWDAISEKMGRLSEALKAQESGENTETE